jgi:hypothetical protein
VPGVPMPGKTVPSARLPTFGWRALGAVVAADAVVPRDVALVPPGKFKGGCDGEGAMGVEVCELLAIDGGMLC